MAFDTERAARRLTDAGMDERAANGVADVVASATDGLATEASLQSGLHALETSLLEVRASIAALEGRIDASIAKLEGRIDASIAALEGRIDASIATLEGRIDASIAALEGRIDASIATLEGRIEANIAKLEARMIKWTVGAILAGMSASAAIAAAIVQLIGG